MASSSFASTKLNLRSTSKISLSDRFKLVRQKALINRTLGGNKAAVQPQVSRKNRLLAQLMANKPSVLAALKIKRKTIKQRLGKVKPKRAENVNRPFKKNKQSNQRNVQTSGNRFRLNRNNYVGTNRVSNQVSRRGRNKTPRNLNQTGQVKANIGNRSGIISQARFRSKNRNRFSNRVSIGGGFRNNQTRFRGTGLNRPRNNNKNKGRNQRGNNQRRGRRSNFQNKNKKQQNQGQGKNFFQRKFVNKNQLDKDLDEYMAKTRSQLDADLDAYMAGA